MEELEARLAEQTGFRINRHLLQFVGLCQDCQE
jgi:Fe2+ or Zn2+ uptake regulation protein